jgi:hypothetical protein
MTSFPDAHRDLLDGPVATFATIGGNGLPHLTMVTIEPANVHAVDMSAG